MELPSSIASVLIGAVSDRQKDVETRAALLSLLEKYEEAERRRHQAWMNLVHGAMKALGGEEK